MSKGEFIIDSEIKLIQHQQFHLSISPLCHMNASVNHVSISYDNGLSPIHHQAIILTSAVLLSIWSLETNFIETNMIMAWSPIQHQAIILTGAVLLPIWLVETNFRETNFSEISIKMQKFSFMKMHLKITSAKRQPFCPGQLFPPASHWPFGTHNTSLG